MGPLCLRRSRELGRPGQRARPHRPVRCQRLLVRLRHGPPRWPPGHPVHRHRRRQGAGAERGLRQGPLRPAAPRVGEAQLQPGHPDPGRRHGQQLPRPDGGVAWPRRPVEGRHRCRGQRRWVPARVQERGLPPVGAQRRAAARQLAGRARAGVPGPVPRHVGARRDGGARNLGERRRAAARSQANRLRQGGPLHGRAVRRRGGHLRAGGARARRRPRELAAVRPRAPVRVQVLLRRAQEAARAVGVGGRDRRRRRGQRVGGHPGVPEGDVAGRRREAAGAVARGGDRDAEEEPGWWPAVGDGGGGRRQEGDRGHRELAGGRGSGLRGPEPGGGRDVGPEMAAGSAEKGASVHGGVGPFGLLVMASGDLEEHTAVFFRVFRHLDTYKVLMCTDLTKSSRKEGVLRTSYGAFLDVDVQKNKFISLRTLIDHTVVESFGDGGRTCITARVYPDHAAAGSSRLYVFNNGTGAVKVAKLEAWELATAAMNGGAGASAGESKVAL